VIAHLVAYIWFVVMVRTPRTLPTELSSVHFTSQNSQSSYIRYCTCKWGCVYVLLWIGMFDSLIKMLIFKF